MAELERPTWDSFQKSFRRRWKQGEHVFLNGQTGSGKTELLLNLLGMRGSSVVMVTKPRDPIFKSPLTKDYVRVYDWDKRPRYADRILLAPKGGDSTRDLVGKQQEVFDHALDAMFADGSWTVGVDETLWISNRLKLADKVGDMSFMGRALGLTVVSATQRPAHIPVIVPQSASHAFIGKTGRKDDLKRLAELGGDTVATERGIASLRSKHDFLYVDVDHDEAGDTRSKTLPLVVVNTQA